MKSGRGGPRPNSGRKPRSDTATTKLVTIRFTEAEYAHIKQKATEQNITIPDYIRSRI